jgi:hypothetical protein
VLQQDTAARRFSHFQAAESCKTEKGRRVFYMNARMRLIARERAGLFFVFRKGVDGNLQSGRWQRLRKKVQRMLLLLRSPIASLRWARAKSQALTRKKQNTWQSRRSNNFAECERDGIIMGF